MQLKLDIFSLKIVVDVVILIYNLNILSYNDI